MHRQDVNIIMERQNFTPLSQLRASDIFSRFDDKRALSLDESHSEPPSSLLLCETVGIADDDVGLVSLSQAER